jgi:hypothetical protein
MSDSKYLKGECQRCAGHLEFLVDHVGVVVPCPHCGQETELLLPRPPEEPAVPRRAIIWTGIAVLVLGLGLAGAILALKRARKWAEGQKQQAVSAAIVEHSTNFQSSVEATNAPPQTELLASEVTLEKAPGTSLVYAVGTVKNTSNRQRFGLKVELDLSDATGQKLGTASDYKPVLEPGAEWQFKALVVDSKAKSATVKTIHEDQ